MYLKRFVNDQRTDITKIGKKKYNKSAHFEGYEKFHICIHISEN